MSENILENVLFSQTGTRINKKCFNNMLFKKVSQMFRLCEQFQMIFIHDKSRLVVGEYSKSKFRRKMGNSLKAEIVLYGTYNSKGYNKCYRFNFKLIALLIRPLKLCSLFLSP